MPVPGAVLDPATITSSEVDLTAPDGHRIPVFFAQPVEHSRRLPALLVIPHGLGLDAHIRDVTQRFAAQGFLAAAADFFARFGGPPPEGADREMTMRIVNGVEDAGAIADLSASARWLRAQRGGNGRVACIGFCMGGRLSLLLATHAGVVDRAIDCWGGRITRRSLAPDDRHPAVVVERVERLDVPLLGVFGAEDPDPNGADVAELRAALQRKGVDHRIVVYDDAGHAFFADTRPSYRDAQAHLAWDEFLAFLAPLRIVT